MKRIGRFLKRVNGMRQLSLVVALLTLFNCATGCVAVGYSSSGGWFVWPGGLGLLVIILLVVFFLRRRR